jgi:drug/metabolite transporter (DMT)-like permease
VSLPARLDLRRAAFYMTLSALAFAFMGAAIKGASAEASNAMVVFFRNFVGLVVLLPWAVGQGRAGLATTQWPGHLVRSLGGVAAMSCFFYAIGHMRLANAVLLNQSFPLFLPIAEWVWLREPVPAGVWRSLAIGFVGIVIIIKPGTDVFTPVALVGLASAVLAAIAQVGIRRLTTTEPVARIVFYFAAIASAVSATALPFAWHTPGPGTLAALVASGAFATLGQFSLTRAYSHAPAASVAPFVYVGVVFAALLDWLIWRRLPDPWFVPGAIIVMLAGASVLRREAPRQPAAAAGSANT